jgi:hypothetical protein
MKQNNKSKKIITLTLSLAFTSAAYSMSKPTPSPEPNPQPTPKPTPAPAPTPPVQGMNPHYFLSAQAENFSTPTLNSLSLKPSCLKRNGLDLLVLDGGHDDSKNSTRSDAKVRGGSDKYVILWPKVHEGQLNMATAWMAYDIMLKDPSLTAAERDELRTMIRFSRHPGEKTFGEYERSFGYYSSTQGTIDSGVTNRRQRVNFMMANHRQYDPSKSNKLSTSFSNVTSNSVVLSIHANSSTYYNEGDVTWIIPPKGTSQTSKSFQLLNQIRRGMALYFGDFFTPSSKDDRTIASLKEKVLPTVRESRILHREHSTNLAMLSSSLGNSNTVKLLLEGFVMNGNAGDVANREITQSSKPMKLKMSRSGTQVMTYDISNVYINYAQSIAQGISDRYGCK